MKTLINFKVILIALVAQTAGTYPAFAIGTDLVSPADALHFEQTYEDWAKSVIHDLNPKLNFTILAHVEFTKNPALLQDYDEMRSLNHLPGLPEVADPNYNNPLESPIYALALQKKFKIIMNSKVSANEIRVIQEVLRSKTKLKETDQIEIEMMNPEVKTKIFSRNNANAFGALALGLLFIGASIFASKRKKKPTSIAAIATSTKEEAKTILPPKINTALMQIQATSSEQLKKILAEEKAELIAKAGLNAGKAFAEKLLVVCEPKKSKAINEWMHANQTITLPEESNYARLLIAAKIQQAQNQSVLSSIQAFTEARKMKAKIKTPFIAKEAPIAPKKKTSVIAQRKLMNEGRL